MTFTRIAYTALAAGLAAMPQLARAQEAVVADVVTDQANTADGLSLIEGRGLEVAPGVVFHPGVSVEGGYDDNIFHEEDAEDPASAGMMRVNGRLYLSNREDKLEDLGDVDPETGAELTPRSVEFRAGVHAAYQEFLNGNDSVREQRNLNVNALADITVLPKGPVAFILRERFIRAQHAPNFEDSSTLARDDNRLWLGLRLQPVGKTIRSTIHYENWLHVFENLPNQFADRMNHTIGWLTEFQWRPFTKFSADVTYGFFGPLESSTVNGMPFKTDSRPFRIVGGVSSLMTPMSSIKVFGGYTRAAYEVGPGYSAPVAGAELGFRWSESGRFVLLYNYEHFDSFNANFYRDHAIAAKFVQRLGFAVLDGGPDVIFRKFEGIPAALGESVREDVVVGGVARLQFVLAEKFAIFGQYRLGLIDTDYRANILDEMGNTVGIDDPSFTSNEISAGVSASY